MSPKWGFEFNPAQLKPQRSSMSGICGFPLLLYSGVMRNQPDMLLSPDLGGSENKRSESQSYALCMPQAQTSPKHDHYTVYSQGKAIWTEDYVSVTQEGNTKARLRVGMLIKAAFTEGKMVTSDNDIWEERWYYYSYHGSLRGIYLICCQRPRRVPTSSQILKERKREEKNSERTTLPIHPGINVIPVKLY